VIVAAITGESLLTFLITGMVTGGIYALSALGLVVVYRATGILNFAQGAIGAVAAMTLANEFIGKGRSELLGYIVAIILAVALSLFYGMLIAPRLAHRDQVVRAIGALGFALFILGFCGWRWTARVQKLELPTDTKAFAIGGVNITWTRVIVIIITFAVAIGITLFLNRTRIGLSMRAMANDRELSSMIGVNVPRTELVAWTTSGVLAGITGILFGAATRLDPASLTFLVIPAVAAAVVGQLRSLWWTVAGAMIIGIVEAQLRNFSSVENYNGLTGLFVGATAILLLQRTKTVSFAGAGK
jgi:branched-chain amino acid transport system permease protein